MINFKFFALEKRPAKENHPQASRVVTCTHFNKERLVIQGKKRYDEFKVLLSFPPMNKHLSAKVKVIKENKDSYEVIFINPSKKLLKEFGWWL